MNDNTMVVWACTKVFAYIFFNFLKFLGMKIWASLSTI